MGANWQPERTVEIVAGTPPGGGLDRVARALANAVAAAALLEVPVEVHNVPGDGARRVWTDYVSRHPGDGHVLSISSPNLTTDYLVGIADFEHTHYSPIATLVSEYITFAVRADSAIGSGADLLARLGREPATLTVALSTALGNPNHIAFAKLTRQVGGDVNAPAIRVFDSALDAVADVVAGNADLCAVTTASVAAERERGNIRLLAVSAPQRLAAPFADMPTWRELGADCVVGAWRGVTGPAGLTQAQIDFWQDVLRAAVAQPAWQDELVRLNWSPMYADGASLRAYLDAERSEYVAVLGELGLLKASPGG